MNFSFLFSLDPSFKMIVMKILIDYRSPSVVRRSIYQDACQGIPEHAFVFSTVEAASIPRGSEHGVIMESKQAGKSYSHKEHLI